MNDAKLTVKQFYAEFGWSKDAAGRYTDTKLYGDHRRVMRWYHRLTNRRVLKHIAPRGRYFLDAGSGPVPHAEYLEYSRGFEKRVCVDFSWAALKEARAKLGDHGWVVQADITKLPFRDDAFDAVVAAHILYHVPQEEQMDAMREMHRTAARGRSCVILYTQATTLFTRWSRALSSENLSARVPGYYRLFGSRRAKLNADSDNDENPGSEPTAPAGKPPLYVHAYPYHWFRNHLPASWRVKVRPWRVIDKAFSNRFVPNNIVGDLVVRCVACLEAILPRVALRIGRYPMIIIRKK